MKLDNLAKMSDVLRTEKTDCSPFFENLLTMEELLLLLKQQYSIRTVYSWVRLGMPHKKIRGKLWFPRKDVELWLERSS